MFDQKMEKFWQMLAAIPPRDDSSDTPLNLSTKGLFVCLSCHTVSAQKCSLRQNKGMQHSNSDEYECAKCGQVVPDRGDLKIHMLTKHSCKFSFPCQNCSHIFGNRNSFMDHVKTNCKSNVGLVARVRQQKQIHPTVAVGEPSSLVNQPVDKVGMLSGMVVAMNGFINLNSFFDLMSKLNLKFDKTSAVGYVMADLELRKFIHDRSMDTVQSILKEICQPTSNGEDTVSKRSRLKKVQKPRRRSEDGVLKTAHEDGCSSVVLPELPQAQTNPGKDIDLMLYQLNQIKMIAILCMKDLEDSSLDIQAKYDRLKLFVSTIIDLIQC